MIYVCVVCGFGKSRKMQSRHFLQSPSRRRSNSSLPIYSSFHFLKAHLTILEPLHPENLCSSFLCQPPPCLATMVLIHTTSVKCNSFLSTWTDFQWNVCSTTQGSLSFHEFALPRVLYLTNSSFTGPLVGRSLFRWKHHRQGFLHPHFHHHHPYRGWGRRALLCVQMLHLRVLS